MPYIFGMYIKSKDEREQEYENYCKSIFPRGERQKAAVEKLLKELIPKEPPTLLMMYFIQLKEQLLADPSLSPARADAALPRHTQRPRGRSRVLALLNADLHIDDSLSYPTVEELISWAQEWERLNG